MSTPTARSRAAGSNVRRAESRRAESRRAESRRAESRRAESRRAEQLLDEQLRTRHQRANRRRAALLAGGPAALVAGVAFAVTAVASWLPLALVMAIVAGGLVGILLFSQAGPLALRLLGAVPAGDEAQPRVHNLIEGLSVGAGVGKPEVWVLDSENANALVVATGQRRSWLVVTTALVSRLSRVELEGVLAREIGKLRSGEAVPATVAAAAGWPLVLPSRTRSARTAVRQADADVAAVALTCYPPGLAAALEGLADQIPVQGLAARLTEHLWLVSPAGPAGPRAAALRQL